MSSRAVALRKKLNRLTVTWLARLLMLMSRVVPYRFGVFTGGVLGVLLYYVLPRERKRALDHLRMAFVEKSTPWIRRTARGSFKHLGKSIFEIMLLRPEQLKHVVVINGAEKIAQARSLGKGVIYVTGHVGNWELQGGLVASQFPLSVVAAPIIPDEVNDLIVQLRGKFGTTVILRGKPGASRDLIRIFRENRVLGVLIDQDTDIEGAFVPFMGRPAWTPTAAASMAIRFNAPVVFGYIHRQPDGRHIIHVEGPLKLIRTGNDEQDIIANTALFTKMIEDSIMRHPEQWVWMHRRWRKQP